MKIHLWTPGVEPNSGGIEKYSRFLLEALIEIFGGHAISVLAKNDGYSFEDRQPKARRSVATGAVPSGLRTAAFSARAAAAALWDRPDLIISTHLNFTPLARWLKRLTNIPYWSSLHGIEAWDLADKNRRRGLADADLLLPVSRFTGDLVSKEQGIPDERFRILPNTFEPEEFKIGPKPEYLLKRYNLSPDQPVILTVGRLSSAERYKGQDRVLRSLKAIVEQSGKSKVESRNESSDLPAPGSLFLASSLRYLIVGDGDDRPRLEKLAEELGVGEMVTFAGKVPAEELCAHYNLCDVFAMPSKGEGFGIVFLEAMACGKPVIAGNKDASRDAVLDGELGVLVDPDNLQELTEALVAVIAEVGSQRSEAGSQTPAIRDSPSALRISPIVFQPEALRAKVVEHFGYEKFKQRLGEILEPLLEKLKAEN